MAGVIKICGLTNADDIAAAQACGADYFGFILYARSPRGISPTDLCALLDVVDVRAHAVGVFVNATPVHVQAVASAAGLAAVQLHGDEPEDAFRDFPLPIWRAVRLRAGGVEPAPAVWGAERYVVDADVPGQYGGTGVVADWTAAAALASTRPVMLSGGLSPDNVADAIRIVKPLGVDVSSGVEAERGRKDHDLISAFTDAARAAFAVACA